MKRFLSGLCALLLALASPAEAALSVNNLSGFGVKPPAAGGGAEAFGITFTTSATDAANLTTYSFASQNVGADATGSDTRYTVLAIGWGAAALRTVSSASACGVAATAVDAASVTSAGSAIYYANTTGLGTSCTISYTLSGAALQGGIGVYRMINPGSITATDTTCTTATGTGGVVTLNLNIASGGKAVASILAVGALASTWSGLTEDFDINIETTGWFTGANGGSAGSPHAVVNTNSDTTITPAGCSASWAP
jgi:hypothetical protein